jgi:hypothetical protein
MKEIDIFFFNYSIYYSFRIKNSIPVFFYLLIFIITLNLLIVILFRAEPKTHDTNS